MKKNNNCWKPWLEGIVCAYAFLLLCIYPLLFHNAYVDILSVKTHFFYWITGALFIACAWIGLAGMFRHRKLTEGGGFRRRPLCLWFAFVLALELCISWLMNGHKRETFFGSMGRNLGLLVLVSCLCIFWLAYYYLKMHQWLYAGMLISATVILCVAVCNYLGFDPLGMYEVFNRSTPFISTMGNRDTAASYVSLMLPFGMVLFSICESRLSVWIYGIFSIIGFLGSAAVNCDSVYAVLFIVFVILFWNAFRSWRRMFRFTVLLGMFGGADELLHLLTRLRGTQNCLKLEGIPAYMSESRTGLFLLIGAMLFAGMTVLACRKFKISERKLLHLRRWIFGILGVAVCAGAVFVILVNWTMTAQETTQVFGIWKKYLYLDDSWGTQRMKIWRIALDTFWNVPVSKKLFGCGPAGFYYAIHTYAGTKNLNFDGSQLIDAHNEFFQFLVSTGLFGVICYFGIFISAGCRLAFKCRDNKYIEVFVVFVVAFLVQGCINNAHIYIAPLAFLLVAAGLGMAESPKEQ